MEHSGFNRMAASLLGIILVAMIVFAGVQIYYSRGTSTNQSGEDPDSLVARELSLIHSALERFKADSGHYPQDINAVMGKNYIARQPINPYSGEPMKHISDGGAPVAGDFSYVPCLKQDRSGISVDGYALVGYGSATVDMPPQLPEYCSLNQQALSHIVVSYISGI